MHRMLWERLQARDEKRGIEQQCVQIREVVPLEGQSFVRMWAPKGARLLIQRGGWSKGGEEVEPDGMHGVSFVADERFRNPDEALDLHRLVEFLKYLAGEGLHRGLPEFDPPTRQTPIVHAIRPREQNASVVQDDRGSAVGEALLCVGKIDHTLSLKRGRLCRTGLILAQLAIPAFGEQQPVPPRSLTGLDRVPLCWLPVISVRKMRL